MPYLASSRKKLFFLFSFLGIFNVVTAYGVFYISSTDILQERSNQQMASIRAQTSQKLGLYLENLKHSSAKAANEIFISGRTHDKVLKKSLTGIYFVGPDADDSITVLMGGPIHHNVLGQIKEEMEFYPLSNEGLMLRVSHMDGNLVFIFNFSGMNEILTEYEGMGDSGEIYLVGKDHLILSASRHVNAGEPIFVDNASIDLGMKQASGVHTVRDYRNKEVLSAFSPFNVDHLEYILLSEIDKAEVLSPLNSLFPKVFSICLILSLLSIFIAYVLSSKMGPPSEKL